MPITKNTFSGGMVQDIDVHNQRPNTYRFAKNGQLVRNKDGQDGNGANYAFSNIKGTTLVSTLQDGYYPIQAVEVDDYILVLSTNGIYSQIGRILVNGDTYTHQVLFNDRNDPNGDRLNFFLPNPEEDYPNINISFENEYTKRVYISDGRNQDRVFNLAQMYIGYDCEGVSPLTDTPIHSPVNQDVSTTPYPKHLSVHHMDLQMDLVFPKFKFVQRVNGSLKRGAYQYAVRYISDSGYRSNWQTPSLHILVTGTHFPENPEYLLAPNIGYSHHNREMATTGDDSIVNDGLKIEFKGLDTRWSGFEIAFLYSKVDSITHEAMICYKHNSQCGTNPFPSNFIFDHTKHAGIPISTDEFLGRDEVILSSKTAINFEDRLYRMNIESLPNIDLDLSDATIKTKFRYLDCDDTMEPVFQEIPNPKTGRKDGDPLTNTTIKNTSIATSTFGNNTETYSIVNDYLGYKGQQVEHLFRQYMSGETYGIALVLIDRKGNTLFAQHIDDYTIPEQYEKQDNEFASLTYYDGNAYKLRIKGLLIDNIKIPKSKIRDKYGKLNISGFKIVRTKRNGNILHQGIVVPVIDTVVSAGSSIQTGVQIKPHPFVRCNYEDTYFNGTAHKHKPDTLGAVFAVREEVDNENFVDIMDSVAGYSLYFSPDVMIEGVHEFIDTDTIKHVGTAYRAYVSNEIRLSGQQGFNNYNLHFYGKLYNTDPTIANGDDVLWQKYGRRKIGDTSRLKFANIVTDYLTNLKSFDKDASEIEFKNGVIDVAVHVTSSRMKRAKGVGAKNSVLLGMLDFEHIDIRHEDKTAAYRIMNYIRPNDNYLANENTGLDARLYQSTGHYQPITESVLSSVSQDEENYIFSNIEVWGGDTFVNLFDFTRVVPAGTRNCSTSKTWAESLAADKVKLTYHTDIPPQTYPEFASSLIVPIESKYNLALRYGRKFAANATYPQSSYCDDITPQYSSGIMSFQPESFAINSVLLHTENIVFFTQEPPDLNLLSKFENRVYVSDPKISSERYDSFRRQKVLNYGDIDGNCGAIVAARQSFSYIYVIQERGYGILRARERASVATTTGELLIGTGKDIAGIQYISKDIGCQNPKSIIARKNSIWWVDKRNATIVKHGQGGLDEISKSRFLHEYISKVEEAKDVHSGYDSDSGNYYTTFTFDEIQKSFTILFNQGVGFQSELSIVPLLWVSYSNKLLAFDSISKNKLYLYGNGVYGEFFGNVHGTEVEFIINEGSEVGKILDNVFISSNPALFDMLESIEFVGDNQKLLTKASSTFIEQRGNVKFPVMNKGDRDRLRGRVIVVKLKFNNLINQQVLLNSFQTNYRIDR